VHECFGGRNGYIERVPRDLERAKQGVYDGKE
jgi:hypothetical protein